MWQPGEPSSRHQKAECCVKLPRKCRHNTIINNKAPIGGAFHIRGREYQHIPIIANPYDHRQLGSQTPRICQAPILRISPELSLSRAETASLGRISCCWGILLFSFAHVFVPAIQVMIVGTMCLQNRKVQLPLGNATSKQKRNFSGGRPEDGSETGSNRRSVTSTELENWEP